MAKILNFEDAKNAAKEMVEHSQAEQEKKRYLLNETIEQIQNVNPEMGGFEEIAGLLALPEEHFAILAPVFLAELEKSLNNVNDQLSKAQALNASGIRVEDITAEYDTLCKEIDSDTANGLAMMTLNDESSR